MSGLQKSVAITNSSDSDTTANGFSHLSTDPDQDDQLKPEVDKKQEDLESKLPELLDQLRQSLKSYPECKRRDDEFLAKFLRVKDYNVRRAVGSVRGFYRNTHRSHHLIDGISPSQFRTLFDAHILNILSCRCAKGTKVVVIRAETWNPAVHSLHQILQAAVLLFQQCIADKTTQLRGTSIIFDLQGLSLAHARQLTPTILQRLVFAAQEGLPIRLVGVHFLNYPALFWGLYYVARAFMKQKLKQRIIFHSDGVESLLSHFRREILPREVGGVLEMEDVIDKELMEDMLRRDRDYSCFY